MLHTPHQNRQLAGSLLVALQFGLLVLQMVMAAPRLLQGNLSVASVLLAGLSVALAIWTLLHNRLGNFNIHPAPKARGVLVTTGPYRHIRHPMYTSVLLGAAALASVADPVAAWSAWWALVLVLYVKSTLEERWMREHHPRYGAYCQASKRFLPWLF